MARVLITGGAGFIGSHIVDVCLAKGWIVKVIDNLSSGDLSNLPNGFYKKREYDLKIWDIREWRSVEDFFTVADYEGGVIFHQAAQPSLRKSIDDPILDVTTNIVGTLNIIRAARARKMRIVFASTSAVYDPGGIVPYVENDCLKPNLPYGISKMAAESYIRHSGLSYAILRYGNVYGPRQIPVGENQLVPHCLDHIFKGTPFFINGDGDQTRDFVYVGDIVKANMLAMKSNKSGTFNIGSGQMIGINAVCDVIKLLTGYDKDFVHGPSKPGEMRHSGLNSRLAQAVLGWQAETSLTDGLKATIDWYKS